MQLNWREMRAEAIFFAVFFMVFMLFRTTAYGMYHIPSESMLPSLTVGDRIVVNKFAYGYSRHSLPFSAAPDLPTDTGRIFFALPERGDVAVFKHPRTGETYIKRVVGLPGDKIAVARGRLFINDRQVERKLNETYHYREHKGRIAEVDSFLEALPTPDGRAKSTNILERGDNWPADNFGPIVVPEGTLFLMGDNRDNSIDSRFLSTGVGFVPLDRLVGRAEFVLFSTNFGREKEGLHHHRPHLLKPL